MPISFVLSAMVNSTWTLPVRDVVLCPLAVRQEHVPILPPVLFVPLVFQDIGFRPPITHAKCVPSLVDALVSAAMTVTRILSA